MRWFIGLSGLIGLFMVMSGTRTVSETSVAFAQSNASRSQNTLTASGTGIVKAPADVAKVTFAVQVITSDLKSGQEDISTQTQKVLAGIRVLKLDGMEVKLAPLAVQTTPGTGEGLKSTKPTYQLTQTFQVTLKSDDPAKLLDSANTVVGASIANGATASPSSGGKTTGANSGPQVTFSVSDETTKRREALELAIADAMKNAKVLAKGAEVKLGTLIAIHDPPATNIGHPIEESDAVVGATADDFGERDIVVKVTVVFGY